MVIAALIVTLVGVVFSTWGAAWLVFGFRPDNLRYADDGILVPGAQASKVVPNLLADQRRPLGLVAFGGGFQVVGGILALAAGLATVSG